MLQQMDARAGHFGEISRQIWGFAELGYKETRSAAMLREELRKAGFTIQDNIGGIPTAFTATYGSGKPVIGILGEYDALPGLSQDHVPERKPLVEGGSGHGCGHNLFGTASAFAAIQVKEYLAEKKLPGTLRFYGTPAEEGGGGKIYMARAGVFADVDAVLHWHPGSSNGTGLASSLANINARFRFFGKAAHAAANPQQGRSALDGLLLMSHAVEMLREHIPSSARIHYVFTKAGEAPNIVPDFAEGYIYARSPSMIQLDNIWERIIKCAQAGALATDTRMEMELSNSVYNILPNEPLSRLVDKHMRQVGGVKYSPEEVAFAEKLQKTLESAPPPQRAESIEPFSEDGGFPSASTDVGDVSWVVPTGGFMAATYVPGTPGHSWQSTACAGSSIGRKGMVVAAKTLALTAADLYTNPEVLAAAKKDYERRRGGHTYRSRVPADQKPPLKYRE
ncbi:MAG: amidohydrolase [Bryobacterales bacterium]|nr:amidohydrolase [Bryobacterales bacterium]